MHAHRWVFRFAVTNELNDLIRERMGVVWRIRRKETRHPLIHKALDLTIEGAFGGVGLSCARTGRLPKEDHRTDTFIAPLFGKGTAQFELLLVFR